MSNRGGVMWSTTLNSIAYFPLIVFNFLCTTAIFSTNSFFFFYLLMIKLDFVSIYSCILWCGTSQPPAKIIFIPALWSSLPVSIMMVGEPNKNKSRHSTSTELTLPAEPCLNFSFFFFLHFQGLNMRPRLASLLLRRMGGVRTPVTIHPEWSALGCSMTSTTESERVRLSADWAVILLLFLNGRSTWSRVASTALRKKQNRR